VIAAGLYREFFRYAEDYDLWLRLAEHGEIGAGEVYATFAFMNRPVGWAEALVIESLIDAVRGAAFAVPGALGAQEGGLIVLCALFGSLLVLALAARPGSGLSAALCCCARVPRRIEISDRDTKAKVKR
jgi:hypothetical protein